MSQAIREAVEQHGERASREEIRRYIDQKYPDKWQWSTLTAHLYGCSVNNPKAYIHHPHTPKFLFRHEDGRFQVYDPKVHGEITATAALEEEPETAEEAYEVSLSLERDLEEHLAKDLSTLERGLVLVDRQYKTGVGFVDILARDADGTPVVIEIKAGEARDSAVGQVTRYMGWTKQQGSIGSGRVRGILVANGFSEGAQYSASIVPNLALLRFHIKFQFERVSSSANGGLR